MAPSAKMNTTTKPHRDSIMIPPIRKKSFNSDNGDDFSSSTSSIGGGRRIKVISFRSPNIVAEVIEIPAWTLQEKEILFYTKKDYADQRKAVMVEDMIKAMAQLAEGKEISEKSENLLKQFEAMKEMAIMQQQQAQQQAQQQSTPQVAPTAKVENHHPKVVTDDVDDSDSSNSESDSDDDDWETTRLKMMQIVHDASDSASDSDDDDHHHHSYKNQDQQDDDDDEHSIDAGDVGTKDKVKTGDDDNDDDNDDDDDWEQMRMKMWNSIDDSDADLNYYHTTNQEDEAIYEQVQEAQTKPSSATKNNCTDLSDDDIYALFDLSSGGGDDITRNDETPTKKTSSYEKKSMRNNSSSSQDDLDAMMKAKEDEIINKRRQSMLSKTPSNEDFSDSGIYALLNLTATDVDVDHKKQEKKKEATRFNTHDKGDLSDDALYDLFSPTSTVLPSSHPRVERDEPKAVLQGQNKANSKRNLVGQLSKADQFSDDDIYAMLGLGDSSKHVHEIGSPLRSPKSKHGYMKPFQTYTPSPKALRKHRVSQQRQRMPRIPKFADQERRDSFANLLKRSNSAPSLVALGQ